MEMMDKPAIHAAEDFVHAGYPLDVEALLIVELDGPEAEVDHLIGEVEAIARNNGATIDAGQPRPRRSGWSSGPGARRLSPRSAGSARTIYCMDGTIPRKQLPLVLTRMAEMSEHHGLRVANVFHAGDGNLHPLILYDANEPGELEAAEEFGADILKLCVRGRRRADRRARRRRREARPDGRQFNEIDLDQQQRVKCAFDPGAAAQSRQGVPAAAPLRRAGPRACPPRPVAVPRPSAVLRAGR